MIGFIGTGNMATALLQGMLSGGVPAKELASYDINPNRMEAMQALGIRTASSAMALADSVDTVVIAVKPKDIAALLASMKGQSGCAFVSIAAGWTQSMLAEAAPNTAGIARCMPNMPALVGEGVLAFAENHSMNPVQFDAVRKLFAACGRIVVVPEALLDAVTGVSGSGPAYVYMFIEALADAGVRQGLARDTAYTLAAQTLLGAAKMVLETGRHPAALKDEVCSPGGTTIEAVYALEKAGFRSAVMDAVDACAKKAASMANQPK